MLFWSIIFILISFVLMLGNFFQFPETVYQLFPIATLLGSLGLLYRILYKIRQAEKEHYRLKIDKLQQELEEYKRNIVNRNKKTD